MAGFVGGTSPSCPGPSNKALFVCRWAAAAYPSLAPMALFRLDWFITVFQFVALSAVLLALALDNFMQARYHFSSTMNPPYSR